MALPNRSRAWRTSITSVTGTATSTQVFSLGRTNGMPTLPFTAAVVKRGQDANPGTHEEITITAMTGNGVTACTRAVNGTAAIALEPGDSIYQSLAALLDAYESAISSGFIVDGVAYAASTAGVQAAVTAAGAAGGGHVDIAVNLTLSTTSITFPITGNIDLSARPGVTLKAPAAGAVDMFAPTGTRSASSALTSNAARDDRTVVHTPADAARVLAVGDIGEVKDPVTGQTHLSEVVAVSSSSAGVSQTVTFADPLSVAFTTANVSVIYKLTPIPNLYFHDLHFDGNSNTSAVRAIVAARLLDARFERITGTGIKGTGVSTTDVAGLLQTTEMYRCNQRDLKATACGTTGQAAIENFNNTRCTAENIDLSRCGFGYLEFQTNHFSLKNVKGTYSNGRSVGFGSAFFGGGSYDGVEVDCWGNNSVGGYTGKEYRGGTSYLEIFGGGAHKNTTSGMYVQDLGAHHITVHGGSYFDNASSADIDIDPVGVSGAGTASSYALVFDRVRHGLHEDDGLGTLWNGYLVLEKGSPVTNTVTKTAMMSKALYASQLFFVYRGYGNAIQGRMRGVILNNKGTNGTILFTMELGGTTVINKSTGNIASNAAYRVFTIDYGIRDNAATNAQEAWMEVAIASTSIGGTGEGDLTVANLLPTSPTVSAPSTIAKDSTTALTLAISATLSAADANFQVLPTSSLLQQVG